MPFVQALQQLWPQMAEFIPRGIDLRHEAQQIDNVERERLIAQFTEFDAAVQGGDQSTIATQARAQGYESALAPNAPYGVIQAAGEGKLTAMEALEAINVTIPTVTGLVAEIVKLG
jgi:hypothetical protein